MRIHIHIIMPEKRTDDFYISILTRHEKRCCARIKLGVPIHSVVLTQLAVNFRMTICTRQQNSCATIVPSGIQIRSRPIDSFLASRQKNRT
jgi:hypothetical protein